MTVADSTEIFNKPVVLKLDDGTLIPVESSLRYASGAIKDNLPGADPNAESFEFPMSNGVEKPEVDFLNTFMKTLEEKLPNELREKSEDRTYWVDNMVRISLFVCDYIKVFVFRASIETNCSHCLQTFQMMS